MSMWMKRRTRLTRHRVSKMADPNVLVLGNFDGRHFEVRIYASTGAKPYAESEYPSWGSTLEVMRFLTGLGVPCGSFRFLGSIFESGPLKNEPEEWRSEKEARPAVSEPVEVKEGVEK